MLEKEITSWPDEINQSELVAKLTELLARCKSEAWQACPPESVAKYLAS